MKRGTLSGYRLRVFFDSLLFSLLSVGYHLAVNSFDTLSLIGGTAILDNIDISIIPYPSYTSPFSRSPSSTTRSVEAVIEKKPKLHWIRPDCDIISHSGEQRGSGSRRSERQTGTPTRRFSCDQRNR